MDPTNFTLSDEKSSIKFHRAIEPNNPRSALQLRATYISLKAGAFTQANSISLCAWTNLKSEWISVEVYEQVSDPAPGSSGAPIVNRNSSLSGYVPGAPGFDAPGGWRL